MLVILPRLRATFIYDYNDTRIMKIGDGLTEFRSNVDCRIFMGHSVVCDMRQNKSRR